MQDTYRPNGFDGIVGQPTDEIEALIDGKATPNFLFHGPPGTGKTTTAYAIARALHGTTKELMEYNASNDTGRDVIRDEVIPAVNQPTLSGRLRLIFLDEMEAMSKEAQQTLRRPMEQSSAVFVLACNDIETVHDAVQSRCHVFEFGPLSGAAIRKRVEELAAGTGTDLSTDQLKSIVSFANGDMRQAINQYRQYASGAGDPTVDETLSRAAANLSDDD